MKHYERARGHVDKNTLLLYYNNKRAHAPHKQFDKSTCIVRTYINCLREKKIIPKYKTRIQIIILYKLSAAHITYFEMTIFLFKYINSFMQQLYCDCLINHCIYLALLNIKHYEYIELNSLFVSYNMRVCDAYI